MLGSWLQANPLLTLQVGKIPRSRYRAGIAGLSLAYGLVALIVGWSLLTDFGAIKRAGVPILRSLNIQYRLKQQPLRCGIDCRGKLGRE